jgi:hypothetical protein
LRRGRRRAGEIAASVGSNAAMVPVNQFSAHAPDRDQTRPGFKPTAASSSEIVASKSRASSRPEQDRP